LDRKRYVKGTALRVAAEGGQEDLAWLERQHETDLPDWIKPAMDRTLSLLLARAGSHPGDRLP